VARSIKKGPYINEKLLKKVAVGRGCKKQDGNKDVVPPFHDCSRFSRSYVCGTQWKEIYSCIRD